jgi:ribosome-associated translation inhibitor RaiA
MATRAQPLPATVPKPAKRTAGRTTAAKTPLNLRTSGVRVDEALQTYARDRAGRKIGKFATHIERATIRFSDVNGPRGGVDTECKIKVVVSGAASVVVAERATDARSALDAALDTVEGAIRRNVQRRSIAPRRR